MSTCVDESKREYILAEFRCAVTKARLAQCELEAVALALKHKVVTPEQAVALFWESDAIQFLGLELNGASE